MPAKDEALREQIQAVHREHPAYGHRRVALHLNINRKRAQRVMAKYQLYPPRRRVKKHCTRSTPHHSYQNLLKNLTITQPNQVWCSDVSRLVYRGTLWYLATIEDLATRQVLAKQIGKRHDSHLVLATLEQALVAGHVPQIFHSDQGTEFMAQRCTDALERRGVRISVSDVASPWQNGFMESFYGRLKAELGDIDRFESAGEMLEAVYRQIHYYNEHRIHTVLKMPPVTYAARFHSDNGLQQLGA
jgi:putative transposase